MVVELQKIAKTIPLTKKTYDLFTRYVGKSVYEKTCEKLRHISEDEVVFLDFTGIRTVDASFVDECIVKLLALSRQHCITFYIKLINLSDSIEYVINQVIAKEHDGIRYAVMTDRLCSNGCHALGALTSDEKDIIEYCVINKKVSAHDVEAFLKITSTLANEYLETLYSLRVLKKHSHYNIYIPV